VGNLIWLDYLEIVGFGCNSTPDKGYFVIGNGPLCGAKEFLFANPID